MVYMGSKNRLAKYIVPIIQDYIDKNDVKTYVELFVGGGNLIDKIKCENKIGCDINKQLISLLTYVRDNPTIPIAPKECTFEHFKDVRDSQGTDKYSDEYTALISFCASYCGGGFPRGYARGNDSNGNPRDMYNERVINLKKQAPNLNGIKFKYCDYKSFDYKNLGSNNVYYLDPPYKNTKKYDKQNLDYEEFYDFCRELAKNNKVFISESYMPDDFKCIWEKERSIMLDSGRNKAIQMTEKLFTI